VVRPARSISPKAVLHLAIQGPNALEMKATTNGSTRLHLAATWPAAKFTTAVVIAAARVEALRETDRSGMNPTTFHDRL
jgi:hypothetical protein